jgi:hopanoid biosynthesis associated RND transporter like protein HpnN
MLRSSILRVVDFCSRYAWWVIVLAITLAALSSAHTVRHFAIKTDVKDLFPPDLPWAQRALDYMKAFPQPDVLVVVDVPTPEFVDRASTKLAQALEARSDLIHGVRQLQGGRFFEQNGLLFLPTSDVAQLTEGLTQADPILQKLAADPSLRGALGALSLGLMGVQFGQIQLDDLARPMSMAADTVQEVLEGRPASFSWRVLASGKPPEPQELRRFIEVQPRLDFSALQPGRLVTDAIVQTARELKLGSDYQARVRLTGLVPMNDDQFVTIKDSAPLNAAVSIVSVLVILWLALRFARMILAVAVTLVVGLAISAAFGLFLVGALNLISVAFFVLFIGLGVDFGLQFSVRYRAERHDYGELRAALRSAARKAGVPLALAAAATAVGFASFLPTSYRGLSELGQIAGSGMIIAFLMSISLLPALLTVLKPPAEPRPMGFASLAPVDRFLQRHRVSIVGTTLLLVVLASPLLLFLPFDFNPLHVRNPNTPSVATFLDLRKDPQTGANAIEVMAPNADAAQAIAQRLASLPQVARIMTLDSLVPSDQDEKLKLIQAAANVIEPSLNPAQVATPPSDAETIEALSSTANTLSSIAGDAQGPGPDAARRLSGSLAQLAKSDLSVRREAEATVVTPLRISLDQLREELKPRHVTAETIPDELKRAWVTEDGRTRVEVLPKGDPDDTNALRNFVTSVLAIEPAATGPAVLMFEAGNTVVRAFIEAGIFALAAIAVLLWVVLRRIADVLLTLIPLLVAGVVTLELCVVLDLPLNFANIIALPLLLGVGVAFKIYYIMAWRSGKTALVQSTLTRAVIFSAMATATAFGSLWLSSDPGTSSMGQLMALALVCTMTAAVLFQPALMGRPREKPGRVSRVTIPAGARWSSAAVSRSAIDAARPASGISRREPALIGTSERERDQAYEDDLGG